MGAIQVPPQLRDPALHAPEIASLLVAEVKDYAILMLDVDGTVVTWNAGPRRLEGYGADAIIGRHFSIFYPVEAIAAGTPERLLATARTAGRAEREGWRMRKDGSRFWASAIITALLDDRGGLRGFCELSRDLTDRHAAEERFQAAFTHAPIGMCLSDLQHGHAGRFIEVNPALAQMLGYETGELIGTQVHRVTHQGDREAPIHLMEQLLNGQSVSVEMRLVHRDGHEVWALVSSTPLPEPPGQPPQTAISHVLDISERKRFEGQLRELADHDPLTGLFNRHRFEAELDRVIAEANRYGRDSALMIMDLDGFKDVNDQFGHPVGDELVGRIAKLLNDIVRETDVVARLGGDEFAVILPELGPRDAELTAARVRDAIRSRGRVTVEHRHARVTASIGVTTFDGETELAGSELVVEADTAMYEAKSRGRNRYVVHDRADERRQVSPTRRSWTDRLRTAVEQDQFVLHAQPILGICGDGIPRYELLLRLRDDRGHLMPPGAFLSNAERFDLMGAIDRWVLGQAIQLLDAHGRAGNDISLSVNLSGKTMNDDALPAELAGMLAMRPIEPDRLVIEVTETAAIVNIDRARELANDLRGLGCGFALDDFGSGFASFYYLKHLDFDFLKIDGEFIRKLSSTPTDQLVVRAVVDIARGLDTKTVAEFVGDEVTVELLRSLGIDYGQGYHLGRPGPVSRVLPPLPDAAGVA
jgi:diguanylate cyclase (GGDEF)-like protein/PAS domain S-box-containing protein